MTIKDDMKNVIKVVVGLLLAAVGIVIILADIHVAFADKESAHIINQVIGVGLLLFGGIIVSPNEITNALKTLGGLIAPYLPKHNGDS